ncbi:protein stum homolog [Ptychodera flava]|uniref:protein stum homolog n=1 Tax=Ptychodera flava TaxID=63121 RepID=UPI003969C279
MSYPKQVLQPQVDATQPPPPPGYEEFRASQAAQQPMSPEEMKQNKARRALLGFMHMLPAMHQCMAWTCFILNCIVPGIGTIVAAFAVLTCCSKHPSIKDRCRVFCINFWFGWLQLISSALIVGFIWAAWWGWLFVVMSYIGYHDAPHIPEAQEVVVGERREEK